MNYDNAVKFDWRQGRYMLFGGYDCYAGGGFNDLVGAFATLEEAVEHGETLQTARGYVRGAAEEFADPPANVEFGPVELQWWHVVDAETREIVFRDPVDYGIGQR
jgi:hypothetical protein